jgi:hypothetical protein
MNFYKNLRQIILRSSYLNLQKSCKTIRISSTLRLQASNKLLLNLASKNWSQAHPL